MVARLHARWHALHRLALWCVTSRHAVHCRSADLYLLSVAAADGSHTDNEHLTAPATLGGVAAVSGSSVAVVSKDGNQLCTLTLDGEE